MLRLLLALLLVVVLHQLDLARHAVVRLIVVVLHQLILARHARILLVVVLHQLNLARHARILLVVVLHQLDLARHAVVRLLVVVFLQLILARHARLFVVVLLQLILARHVLAPQPSMSTPNRHMSTPDAMPSPRLLRLFAVSGTQMIVRRPHLSSSAK